MIWSDLVNSVLDVAVWSGLVWNGHVMFALFWLGLNSYGLEFCILGRSGLEWFGHVCTDAARSGQLWSVTVWSCHV